MKAKLILENKDVFWGYSFGAEHSIAGEVVFNTGMVGYPETLTDPSYKGQILVLTYPLIGNYGVPDKIFENNILQNFESDKIHVQGLIISDYSFEYSHWNAKKTLSEWLKEENIPALHSIDTRALTKILREKGAMLGKIIFDKDNNEDNNDIGFYDPNVVDVVKEVSVKEPVIYNENIHNEKGSKRIVVIDCGIKNNILRNLIKRNLTVIRVPYNYDFFQESFDGIVISNGPGDPKMCKSAIDNVSKALKEGIPTFGICLGSQLMALAAGGDTYKLKYGHRSQNQPCILHRTKRCFITTQNHGFAVNMKTLSNEWGEFFVNANDGTNEGIRHKTKPFFSVQFHPEACPGPNDTEFLFDEFVRLMD